MNKINLLSKKIISQIAAGEVIERPVSVVKELVENSIDAGAKNISVIVKEAGLKEIKVIDDGLGIGGEDLKMCYKSHTTSKIFKEEDLNRISSLGFRGEALSSIALVSGLQIKSKLKNGAKGFEVKISKGRMLDFSQVGMPAGTQIMVESLFKDTPARRKFLKSSRTEFNHILVLLNRLALAFPQIGFALRNNKKEIFSVPAGQTISKRMRFLLKEKIHKRLIPLKVKSNYALIEGFVGMPQIAFSNKSKQYLFVNGRLINNPSIARTIKEAYGSLISNNLKPTFLLALKVMPETVDVNIHPRKEEVKFLYHEAIIGLINKKVKQVLRNKNLFYKFESGEDDFKKESEFFREDFDFWRVKEEEEVCDSEIIQIKNKYLAVPSKKGFLVIDQHAAHERILFDELKRNFAKRKNKKEKVLFKRALTFELPITEANFLEQNLKVFEALGFEIELFGQGTFKVNAVPKIFHCRRIEELITELNQLMIKQKKVDLDWRNRKILNFLACKNAIKTGEKLKPKERRRLIKKLFKTRKKFTCPHGRPVIVEFSEQELDKLFKRR
ncbi:MAG: DNA mismatch repair endonuclease MutL [Candidatus Moranbacteria bacterium]|nr:DNA mismatch repair endonuclease MutL [Candidatus Moranbacteria bacterium]